MYQAKQSGGWFCKWMNQARQEASHWTSYGSSWRTKLLSNHNRDHCSRVFPCEHPFSSVPNRQENFKWQTGHFKWHFLFRVSATWCLYWFCTDFWMYDIQLHLSRSPSCSSRSTVRSLCPAWSSQQFEIKLLRLASSWYRTRLYHQRPPFFRYLGLRSLTDT